MLASVVAILVVVTLGSFGWWAATRIDDRALERQTDAIRIGLSELAERTAQEQQSSTLWDDAVLKVRERDDPWLAENLAEWISSYFGHDRVYLFDPANRPLRAVTDGERLPEAAYDQDRAAVDPLIHKLRTQMATASLGQADSTAALSGIAVVEPIGVGDGEVGIVSVRPLLPSSDRVAQAPGDEYLHVSIRLLDEDVANLISGRFALQDLRFDHLVTSEGGRASTPVLDRKGRILGFFSWLPYRPATQLLHETAPVAGLATLLAVAIGVILIRRLRRTSAQLEVSEQRAKYLAFHDALAGIPNRALFEDRLDRALAGRRHSGKPMALHLIDVDRFKHINDTLGHPVGDELIRQVATRLQAVISEVDTVARLGGDEFAVIQVDLTGTEEALRLSGQIVTEIGREFDLLGHEVLVSASVGLAISANDDIHREDIVRQADLALYEAKTSGRARYQLYAGELDLAVRERRELELDLRAALSGKPGLELVYQPIFGTSTGRIEGAEALVRWNHPARGRLAPDMFIGLAEERGLIDQLGMWVLRNACAYAKHAMVAWVAVNVSPLQFRDEHFADRVLSVLKETGLKPGSLELEITEGLLLQDSPIVQQTLIKLRASGIRVALDDFGTGYSSISYLRTYGVDKLKIDRSYVSQLGLDLEIDRIVKCIIDLARAMSMKVTAEGVETEEQRRLLHILGCDQLQGFLLSRPVTPERLDVLTSSDPGFRMEQRRLLAI